MGQTVDTEGLLQAELVNPPSVETAIIAPSTVPPLLPRFQPASEFNGLDIPFPVSALGKTAAAAVLAVGESSQAPVALCAQTVLGVMSAVASMYGDVETIQNRAMPMAVFLMTIAKSGERKSEAHTLASKGILAYQAALSKDLPVGASAEISYSEPSYEGLLDRLERGPGVGFLSNDDAAGFFGSHAMSQDQRAKFLSGVCQIFSGQTINRPRVTKQTKPLSGVPLTFHLMFQPYLVNAVFGNRELCEQGFLPRTLPTFPRSTMGTRKFSGRKSGANQAITDFNRHCLRLLESLAAAKKNWQPSNDPLAHPRRVLSLSEEAAAHLIDFYDEIEVQVGIGGTLNRIASFATRATENATRLAAIMSVFDSPDATEVSLEAAQSGVELARFYVATVQGLIGFADAGNALGKVAPLAKWLTERVKPGEVFHSQWLLQYAPNKFRKKETLGSAIATLVERGWLIPQPVDTVVDGVARKQSFCLHPDATW
jgi:hypothetical protein